MRIAVLGLGHMGKGVATRLLGRGHEVTVWNRTPGKAGELTERGAREAGNIATAVQTTEVVLVVLADDAAVRTVCLGDGGVVHALPESAILVDMSTVSPGMSRELSTAVPERFIDAPILGSPEATASGQARLFVGGPPEVVTRLEPLWSDLSAGYTHTGPNGSATTLKVLSNLLLIGGIALLSESLVTGERSGISTDQLRQIFAESAMIAPGLRNRFSNVLEGNYQGWFPVQLAAKDVRLALDLAHSAGITISISEAILGALEKAEHHGYGNDDLSAVAEAVRSGSR